MRIIGNFALLGASGYHSKVSEHTKRRKNKTKQGETSRNKTKQRLPELSGLEEGEPIAACESGFSPLRPMMVSIEKSVAGRVAGVEWPGLARLSCMVPPLLGSRWVGESFAAPSINVGRVCRRSARFDAMVRCDVWWQQVVGFIEF